MTPHIEAKAGDFAETCLLPGDPLRAKYIVDNYLENVECVNKVRNMFGYTGTYKGKRISVMSHGMGMPSVSIYAAELINEYGVKNIIRIGSCGALQNDLKLGDLIVATAAGTDSKMNRARVHGHDFAATADFGLVKNIVETAEAEKIAINVGRVFTSDYFYGEGEDITPTLQKYAFLGIEMEAAGLFGTAISCGAKAAAIITVSDHIFTGDKMTTDERETSLKNMIVLGLESAIKA